MITAAAHGAIATGEPVVQVRRLSKSYGAAQAVRDLSFDIYPGEIFGLIGPDGAGKTTTFHILGGVLEQTAGDVTVLKRRPRDARLEIGYLTQQFSLYLDLSIDENIRYIAGLREVSEPDYQERRSRYLKLMDLDRFPDRLAGQLSGGMKQKLALCCALIARPRLLLLDEPTTGVDPVSRREFWQLLSQVVREGVTVAVATPYLDEAERCNRLILMHEGELQEMGSPAELKAALKLHRLEVRGEKLDVLERRLSAAGGSPPDLIADVQPFGDRLDVLTAQTEAAERLVRSISAELATTAISVETQDPTLENVFVSRLRAKVDTSAQASFPFVDSEPRNSQPAIFANGIAKTFGSFQAVKSVSLSVGYGEVYGLLGANGAGKTTTIKMLCGLISPTEGEMALCGERGNLRSEALRQRLGYMSQKFTLYDDLTIGENLEFYCGVYCVPASLRRERVNWVLKNSGLLGQEGLLTARLPGGWKQRLAFGAAVLHQPEVLFLDEPTSGVDPLARREMWKLIREFAENGTAILVTTHFLEEAEHCNKLGFMVAGEVVAEGPPGSIKAELPGQLFEFRYTEPQRAFDVLSAALGPGRVSVFADTIHVVLSAPAQELLLIESTNAEHGLSLTSQRSLPFSLEDAFLSIVERASGGSRS